MTRKRNPFLLFCISLIPGAGEMYLGFFKHGISVMTLFFLFCMGSGIIATPLFVFTPVVWFYSFFHSNNLNSMPDEEFYAIEDSYFLHVDQLFHDNAALLKRYHKLVAGILIFLGASILWNSFSSIIRYIMYNLLNLPDTVTQLIMHVTRSLPNSVIAVVIIAVGITMIKHKNDSLNSDDM